MIYAFFTILIVLIIVMILIMFRPKKKFVLRSGNRALDYLLNKYNPLENKVKLHIDQLPMLGAGLFELVAEPSAKDFCDMLDQRANNKNLNAVSHSIFDIILTVYFDEMFEYLDRDKNMSSLLVDALLFQTLGREAGHVTEADLLNHETQNIRGIQKYLIQGQILAKNTKIKDPKGWLLGKEIACILTGGPAISMVMPISIYSIITRNKAKAIIRSLLYNESIDKTKMEKLSHDIGVKMRELDGLCSNMKE